MFVFLGAPIKDAHQFGVSFGGVQIGTCMWHQDIIVLLLIQEIGKLT